MNKWYLSLLTVFFISGSVYAANETTSSIRGDVNVSEATVQITHTPTGTTKTVVTDAEGTFNVSNLRPGGPYVIAVSKTGYSSERVTDVYLSVSQTSNLDVTLSSSSIDEVVVTGSKTSFTKFGSGLAVTAEDIEGTPSIERSISEYVKRDSRIIVDGEARNATISVSGTNNRYNNFTVDGVAQNDPLGLNANGFPSVRNPISIETLEQISVDISPFDVSKGNFTGASINAVTKSGSNEFKGNVFYEFANDGLQGDELEGRPVSLVPYDEAKYGFTLGGPIIQDKLYFFTSYERYDDQDTNDYGYIGSGLPNEQGFLSESMFNTIVTASNDLYGFDPGGLASALDSKSDKLLVKLDYYINDTTRAVYTFNYSDGFNNVSSDASSSEFEFDKHFYTL